MWFCVEKNSIEIIYGLKSVYFTFQRYPYCSVLDCSFTKTFYVLPTCPKFPFTCLLRYIITMVNSFTRAREFPVLPVLGCTIIIYIVWKFYGKPYMREIYYSLYSRIHTIYVRTNVLQPDGMVWNGVHFIAYHCICSDAICHNLIVICVEPYIVYAFMVLCIEHIHVL